MSAETLRLVMHLSGLVVAAALFLLLPFSPLVNTAIALAYWLVDGIIAEFIYNRHASAAGKAADLRDRVDHPPT